MDQVGDLDLFKIPFSQPPPGVTPNFVKRSDMFIVFLVLIPIFIFITTVFTIFRIRSRYGRNESWKIDDWLTLAAWVCSTTLGIILCTSVQSLGRPGWDISIGFIITLWAEKIVECLYVLVPLSVLLGKLCFLALHYRLFGHIETSRRLIYWTLALCSPILASCVLIPLLGSPFIGGQYGWTVRFQNLVAIIAITVGSVATLVDCLLIYIPILPLMRMNLSRKKRGGVIAIFLTGSIAIFADVAVVYYRIQLFKRADALRDGIICALCSFVETSISIICSSMPCAAKVWKFDIVESSVYVSFRARFGLTQPGKQVCVLSQPTNIRYAKATERKRPGLYSIGTFPETEYCMTDLKDTESLVQYGVAGEKTNQVIRSEGVSLADFGGNCTLDNLQRPEASLRSFLSINDPSGYLLKQSNPQRVT